MLFVCKMLKIVYREKTRFDFRKNKIKSPKMTTNLIIILKFSKEKKLNF